MALFKLFGHKNNENHIWTHHSKSKLLSLRMTEWVKRENCSVYSSAVHHYQTLKRMLKSLVLFYLKSVNYNNYNY